jgi:hypothetical protein
MIFNGQKSHGDEMVMRAQDYLENNFSEKFPWRSYLKNSLSDVGISTVDLLKRQAIRPWNIFNG